MQRRSTRKRALPSRARSLFGILCAFVLAVGGQAGRALHGALVPHRMCELHGALEHLAAAPLVAAAEGCGPGASAPFPRMDGKATLSEAPAVARAAPDGLHSPCSMGHAARVEPAPSVPTAPEFLALERGASPAAIARETRYTPIPPLVLAPKHSPSA
jgi:hypothetical protein